MVSVLKKLSVTIVIMTFLFTASCTRNLKEAKLINEKAKFNLIIAGGMGDL